MFGWGQTWQDVTASRSAGVTYTNTTGKPIVVSVSAVGSNTARGLSITVNGVLHTRFQSGSTGTSAVEAVINNGDEYSLTESTGGFTVWEELR